ncbi:MAG: prolipoprotein diacylglyceryl transferase [Armatimonadetes bacterium]|nr:prolipoprotein diacylglyceryl transferase [Armatimonadota bacterium]
MNEAWGVRPVLFHLGGLDVASYAVFMTLALAAAAVLYALESRRQGQKEDASLNLLIAAVVGGVLGSKIPVWLMAFGQLKAGAISMEAVLSGRTILGGLVGGVLAVEIVKRRMGLAGRTGNLFAPSLALAVCIGRVGCFLRGCCYGVTTSLPWGIDFGDHLMRHPTQLYESLFALGLFAYLWQTRRRTRTRGLLFARFMLSYAAFRFFEEFLRAGPKGAFSLTAAQWVCVLIAGYYFTLLRHIRKGEPYGAATRSSTAAREK